MGIFDGNPPFVHANRHKSVNQTPNQTYASTFPSTIVPRNRYRPDPLWVELDNAGVQAGSIRFCGGHHLDHITAYSADGAPVLELCRSDSRPVLTCIHE